MEKHKDLIAALVILFNPDESVLQNLVSYSSQVKRIYVVDNTVGPKNIVLVDKILAIKNIEYTDNGTNKGVATALNIGANRALNDGFDYLLTMDQDSKATESMIEKMLELFKKYQDVGIVTAYQLNEGFELSANKDLEEEILFTMTSGNLLSLAKFKEIGFFLDKLFIDYVDHEFCLRLKSKGFKILRANNVFIYHKLGKLDKRKLFGINFFPSHHSPKRYYYRTRNRFYVSSLYGNEFSDYVKADKKRFFREIIEMIVYESDVISKIKMIIKGYIDFKKKRFTII